MVVVIPTYNPDWHLIQVIQELHQKTTYPIVIVDDGSTKEIGSILLHLGKKDLVLSHNVNRGKGAAIKTALAYIKDNMPEEEGIVFVDGDGQHRIDDVIEIAEALQFYKNDLILGSRTFAGDIPWKSKVGNTITRTVFHIVTGVKLMDTQTGLRAISTRYLPELLAIQGERYEYETNVLLEFCRNKIPILEFPITTVYEDGKNRTSHYRPFADSLRIGKVVFGFMFSSMFCACVDYGLFSLLVVLIHTSGAGVVICNCLARMVSAAINYSINKTYIFKDSGELSRSAARYASLALSILVLNSLLLYSFVTFFHIPSLLAKIITELLLFVISFLVQQRVVFTCERGKGV